MRDLDLVDPLNICYPSNVDPPRLAWPNVLIQYYSWGFKDPFLFICITNFLLISHKWLLLHLTHTFEVTSSVTEQANFVPSWKVLLLVLSL